MKDYEKEWDDFWFPLLRDENDMVSIDKIKRELFDYSRMLSEIPKIFDHITGGKLSKPNYTAETVIRVSDDHTNQLFEEWLKYNQEDEEEEEQLMCNENGHFFIYSDTIFRVHAGDRGFIHIHGSRCMCGQLEYDPTTKMYRLGPDETP